ncbi:uncharacterized protein N7529_002872 [Penicillium soppii]|uniref:uncharacterized protein n=1 Tax=Penicillium soppii TaxID=69789 RepID=UPI0025477B43|nr:uncharacterized protein N7529_002872 [Penicillium soppii]KAJ5874442.1 hypothetical protein N7529_002872 [Penicillium soppii]
MGDHATISNDAFAKDKGKAVDPTNEMSMDEASSSESEAELVPEDNEDEDPNNADPIDKSNIIQGGRRTRGKVIDYSKITIDDMEDDEEDDEEYEHQEKNEDDDDQMRD